MSEQKRHYFYQLFDRASAHIHGQQVLTGHLQAESSSFVRFNQGKIRQPGSVEQSQLTLELIEGSRHSSCTIMLSGDPSTDDATIEAMLRNLQEQLPHLPADPHHLYNTTPTSSEHIAPAILTPAPEITEKVLEAAVGLDLVGILAHGTIFAGFANSLGQRNWFSKPSFNLDWSIYSHGDKAIKSGYSGAQWETETFSQKVEQARSQLDLLGRPAKTIDPGAYRAYLTPAAVAEVLELLAWSSFSTKAIRTRQSPLLKLVEREVQLNSSVSLADNRRDGVGPLFGPSGFLKTEHIELIDAGRFEGSLTSPRSAREFDLTTDGVGGGEHPSAIDLAPGSLSESTILSELGRGVYISNLWYLNFSDRVSCRMTGMTRFATFWVEDGQLVAPMNVMRFAESFYRMFGENLIGLTRERHLILDAGTYEQRSTSSAYLPGALIEDFTFTL